ncbi:MAG TPA: hypothetical protein DCG57_10220 [Candidatus Riflebacteria bacterium]|jgi:hypothetical protein|nr:hypothetical protein [Candidatus Riflebacteria bacterium]
MRYSLRRVISWVLVFAVFWQPFLPEISVWASSDAASEIARAKASFQETYNKIMEVKPIELDWFASAAVDGGSALNNIGKDKKDQRDYNKEIEEANKQLVKIQGDARKTMQLLEAGDLDGAAATNPEQTFDSLQKTNGALGKYQEALTVAGAALTGASELMSNLALLLTGVTMICLALSPLFPPLVGVAVALGHVTTAVSIAAGVMAGAGLALTECAKNGITNDFQLASIVITGGTLGGVTGLIMGRLGGKFGSTITKAASKIFGKTATSIFSTAWNPKHFAKLKIANWNVFKNAAGIPGKTFSQTGKLTYEKLIVECAERSVLSGMKLLGLPKIPSSLNSLATKTIVDNTIKVSAGTNPLNELPKLEPKGGVLKNLSGKDAAKNPKVKDFVDKYNQYKERKKIPTLSP